MNELVPALKETLFAPTYELVAEYAEIGIDSLLESDALKGIPVVGTMAAICKVGYNIHERNLIKQTLEFVMGFNAGTISQEKIDEHRYELESDPAKAVHSRRLHRKSFSVGSLCRSSCPHTAHCG